MMELLTTDQMRSLEAGEIESGAVTGLTLMERAGRGVVETILVRVPRFHTPQRAAVFCGPGNNGGDGFVIARLLVEKNWEVDVWFWGSADNLPRDARANYDRFCALAPVRAWDCSKIAGAQPYALGIDAVFGIGVTRPVPQDIVQGLAKARVDCLVAVDCPSGLNLDTGEPPNPPENDNQTSIRAADLTVTFHSAKPGHYIAQGPAMCGALAVVGIGLATTLVPVGHGLRLTQRRAACASSSTPSWPLCMIQKFARSGHKYDHGHAYVFAGALGHGGAGRLAARAALRCGAGLVTLVCPKSALIENAAHLDAVMVRGRNQDAHLDDYVDDRATSFCLGPGAGVGEHTRNLVEAVLIRKQSRSLEESPLVVLDADALTSFENDPEMLFNLVHERTVLTPHGGEFARLFPDLFEEMSGRALSKVDAVAAAAHRAGCTVLLKGPDTVIAGPEGDVCLHSAAYGRDAPWLATAGAGDVLAGMIAGLGAAPRMGDPVAIAEAAVWLHVEAALSFGPGLVAEDIADAMPKVFSSLVG